MRVPPGTQIVDQIAAQIANDTFAEKQRGDALEYNEWKLNSVMCIFVITHSFNIFLNMFNLTQHTIKNSIKRPCLSAS